MPRKQKKSKRHRKGSYDRESDQQRNIDIPVTSLEEDLRQQRIRQQERQKMREMQEEKKKIENEDDGCNHDVGYESRDDNNCAITNAFTRTQHLILKGAVSPASTVPLSKPGDRMDPSAFSSIIRLPPSFLLLHSEQASPMLSLHKKRTLRKLWSTQHHLESITLTQRAASLYCKTKWPQHQTIEHHSNLRCSWDLSCKRRLHPSARTFDVGILGSEPTPSIASIFQDGWGLLRHKSQHKVNSIKAPPCYAIRMHEKSATCGMIVKNTATYSFRWYPLPHATSYVEAHLPRPATDFCFGSEIALFACPRYSTLSSESLNPLFLPLVEGVDSRYYNTAFRTINVQNFPQSDALRVEMMCEQQEKLLGFGHRNGQVSVLDLRASGTVCSILQYEASEKSKGKPLGCVSDLNFLSSGKDHRVLVKRSFGSCQLHDLRKTSSSASNNSRSHTSTTVVYNMDVPRNEIHPTLTAHCNGFAIDPKSQQTMVSPYIARPTGDARLGVWSLSTGHMVGSRLLLANHDPEGTTLHAEVCSKTISNVGDSSSDVWLKCGAITTGKLRSRVGSLHKITIP